MQNIISTTGKLISFNLNSKRKLLIGTVVPVRVEDQEFLILKSRLGNQIKVVTEATVPTAPVAPAEVKTTAPTTQTPAVAPKA